MPSEPYLRYEPSIEQPRPGEAEAIKAIVASIQKLNVSDFAARKHAIRRAHAKGQGYLRGELKVFDDLPPHLRQGLFASGGTYPVIVRLSTAFGELRSDRVRIARGMAIKVLGVAGAKALPDDRSANQDFLLVNHKSYFSDAVDYLWAQRGFEIMPSLPDWAFRSFGVAARGFFGVVEGTAGSPLLMTAKGLADPGNHILGESFYSEAAIRFGDFVARLSAVPVSEALVKLTGQPCHDSDDAILEAVVDFFSRNSAEYEVRAQLCTDLKRTPIDDASIDCPEDVAPPQALGRITLPAQAAASPARRAYADDVLSFDPWRCLADHRPLGSIMRLRRDAYAASRIFRHEHNHQPMSEPATIAEFPD